MNPPAFLILVILSTKTPRPKSQSVVLVCNDGDLGPEIVS